MKKSQGSRVMGQVVWWLSLATCYLLLATVSYALQKNAGSQVICAELISRNDGSIVPTGTTDVYVLGDGGTQTAGAGVVTYEGQGLWCYQPTQAETNYNHVAYTFANSAAVAITVQTYPGDGWAVALPGTFPDGTAGKILGNIPSGVTVTPSQISTGVIQQTATVTANAPVSVTRGDAKTLTFNLGTGWPLTGKKVYFIAKSSPTADNSTAIVNREATITDAANGVATIALVSTETSTVNTTGYYAEVEVRDTDDTNPRTARQFLLKIIQDVRQ